MIRFLPRLFSRPGHQPAFWLVYVLSVLFTFHGLLVAYINSSYMENFVSPQTVGGLFTIGSSLAVLCFLFISRVLRRFGNVKLTIALACIEVGTLLVLAFTQSPATAILALVVFLVMNPLIYLSIDIFSESLIGENEAGTGSKRGLALACMSIAAVLAPLSMGLIAGDSQGNLQNVYLASAAIFSLFILLVVSHFRAFEDPPYKAVRVLEAIHGFWVKKDLRNVFLSHFTLQLFFSWTVIFIPLYLATEVGFGWDKIGSIIAVGLFAYVILEFPVGILADRYIGEKEMMAVGFVILAITSSWMSFMIAAPVLSWMILMFMSRVGASLVEATTESYFFKHTQGSDANIIGFFRLTRPLALVLGSLLGTVSLFYLPFNLIFVVLGFMMIPGIFFTLALKDTR